MKDLTKGSPIKLIMMFALPLVLGQLFQLCYSLVDTRIVGQTLGENALASVGATTSLSDFLTGFLNGAGNGFAIITATFFGAKDEKNLKKSVACAFVLGGVMSLLLTMCGMLFLNPMMGLLNIDGSLISDAKAYISVIILGLVFSCIYNVCSAVLRAIGDTVTPLIFLIVSSLLNIVLDYTFIRVFSAGVAGAAYATVLSQAVSAVLCIIRIVRRYPVLHIGAEDMHFDGHMLFRVLSTGLSMGIMISFVNLGTLILQSAINSFGSAVIVSHTASRKLTGLLMIPFSVFGAALATYCGQNAGAGRFDRVRLGIRQTLTAVFIWDVFAAAVAWFCTPELVHLITDSSNSEVISTSQRYMRVNVSLYIIPTVICLMRNSLQGIGNRITPIISSAVELAAKTMFAFALAPAYGYTAIIWCEPVAWALMVVPLLIVYIRIIKKHTISNAPVGEDYDYDEYND